MLLKIKEGNFEEFAQRAKQLPGWLHHFNFNNQMFTGYYKYMDIGSNDTIAAVGDTSFERLRDAYNHMDHKILPDYLSDVVRHAGLTPATSSALELGASTGQLSLHLCDIGFGRVASSEIRKICCDQQRLLLECAEDPRYGRVVDVRNDQTSIDHASFVDGFDGEQFDFVVCSRTLGALANPMQAIKNMRALSRGYVFIYALTMLNPLPHRMWSVFVTDVEDLTSSAERASITPHYWWIPRNARSLGFQACHMSQSELFFKNTSWMFDGYNVGVRLRLAIERLCHSAGLRIGHTKAFDPELPRRTGLNPLYVGYLLQVA
ncbi:MAG: hypothetical protein RBS99_05150 [Rhodospirillales bacterium]|jgi:hypothetical protein|nr:hypothetical protein [Rhodospirillales bacterium]